MKKLSLSILLLVAMVISYAQPAIQFDQTTYDFGKIKEEGGKVTGRFEFTNVGTEDLVLTNVRPGCGCTAANYTKEAIAPGQKGYIEATYNPYNRPGTFNKSIRVQTNEAKFSDDSNTAPYMIFIKGEVIKRPPTQFEIAGYTHGSGMARIKETSASYTVKNTDKILDTLYVRNFWNKPVSFTWGSKTHTCMSEVSRNFGSELAPGQEGIIVIQYDPVKRGAFGLIRDNLYFETNDSIEARKIVRYSVNIQEDFSRMSAKDLKKAPVATYSAVEHNYGNVKKNESANVEIKIKNTGKTPLLIRNVQTSSGYFKASSNMTEVPVDGEAVVTINFKASSRASKQESTVDIITNDPSNPVQVIKVNATVVE